MDRHDILRNLLGVQRRERLALLLLFALGLALGWLDAVTPGVGR